MEIYTQKEDRSPKAHIFLRLAIFLLSATLAVFFIFYGKYFDDFLRLIGLKASVESTQQETITLTTVDDFEGLTDAPWNMKEGVNFSDTVAIVSGELQERNLELPPVDPGTDGLVLPSLTPPGEKGEEGEPPGGGVDLPVEPPSLDDSLEYSYQTPWIYLGEDHKSLTRLLALEYAPTAVIYPPQTDAPGVPLISYSYRTLASFTSLAEANQVPFGPFINDSGIAPEEVSTRILDFAGEADPYVQIKITMHVTRIEDMPAVYELSIDHDVTIPAPEGGGGGGNGNEENSVEVTVHFGPVNLPDRAVFWVYGAKNKNEIKKETYNLTDRTSVSFSYLSNVLAPGDYMVSINDQEGSNIAIKEKLAMFTILPDKFNYDIHLGTFEKEETPSLGENQQSPSPQIADLNGDGVVNVADYAIMLDQWGKGD